MLSHNGPFFFHEGVVVAPDFHDPRQYYYLPNAPHLATDEEGRPAFRFLIFKDDPNEATETAPALVSFLSFDTSLGWDSRTLKKVKEYIEDEMKDELDGQEVRLAPLMYLDGSVRLSFLNRETLAPTAEDADNPTETETDLTERWVPFIDSSGTPSLYGENRAIFNVMLNTDATKLLYGALTAGTNETGAEGDDAESQGGFLPAGVVYDLKYRGMQKGFEVDVTVEWDKVFDYTEEHYGVDLIFLSVDLDDITSKLEENQIVEFKVEINDPEMQAEADKVRKEFQKYVIETFFKPVPNALAPDDGNSTVDDIVALGHGINSVANWAIPTVGYSKRTIHREELRTLDMNFRVDRAVDRRILPQGHLGLFLKDSGVDLSSVQTVVNADDLWKEVEFDVTANADFAGDGIHSVQVDLYYGVTPEGVTIGDADGDGERDDVDDADGDGTSDVASAELDLPVTFSFTLDAAQGRWKKTGWYNKEAGTGFWYRYTVNFAPGSIPGPDVTLSSGWRRKEGNVLVISPRELYQDHQVEAVCVRDFPFDRYGSVQVLLKYEDPNSTWQHDDAALLDTDNRRLVLRFRAPVKANAQVQYEITYHESDGGWFLGAGGSTGSDLVVITDPRPVLKVRAIVGGDRSQVLNIIASLLYVDEENSVHEDSQVVVTPDNVNEVHLWEVPIMDIKKRSYRVRQTIILADGTAIEHGWIDTDRPTLVLGRPFAEVMEVRPVLAGPPLTDNGLEAIILRLKYDDDDNDVHTEKEINFTEVGLGPLWKVDLGDPSLRDFTWEAEYRMTTGFTKKRGPNPGTGSILTISSLPPEGF